MSIPVPITAAPRSRLSLAVRIFLLVVSLLLLALGAAVLVTRQQTGRIAGEAVQHALDASAAAQEEFSKKRLEEVELKIQLIAEDGNFVKYIADAQGGLALGEAMAASDSASIVDLLEERREGLGFDLGLVLDPDANVMARTDQVEALAQSLAEDPFIRSALEPPTPISGYWRMGGKVYQAAVWPLALDSDLIGYLVLALAVDDQLGKRVRKVSDAEIAYLLPTPQGVAIAGSSLDGAAREQLAAILAAPDSELSRAVQSGQLLERLNLVLDGRERVGRLSLLDADGGAEVGAKLQLTASDKATAGYRTIMNTVALAGGLALVVALPLSLLLGKATLRPLSTMARAAKAAAAGNYQSRMAIEGNDELAELSQAFDSLLSDLRGERDIESYVTSLSRLLPDPGEEMRPAVDNALAPAIDSQRLKAVLLGVQAGHLHRDSQQGAADAALQAYGRWLQALGDDISTVGGDLLATGGAVAVFGFSGEHALTSALQGLRAAWRQAADSSCVLAEGEFVYGGLQFAGLTQPVLLGTLIQQTERLLCDSAGGHALMPKSTGEAAKALLGESAVQVAKGALSGKAFYDLRAESLDALAEVAQPAPAAAEENATVVHAATAAATTTKRTPNVTDLPPGSRLGGRYQVISILGTGGMGVVYKARDLELDDIVALKMLKGEALGSREQIESLKVEMKLARKITHPNVLRTFDFGDLNGLPYISMEYVRGMTLRYLLKQSGRVPFTAALRIARQLCAGLQAAHEVGVLHRDIKPENLILEASGNAKLMDFGIARPARKGAQHDAEAGMYVGTPRYSPPEQLTGETVDHRADIYAAGVLMQEMFCGKLPYAGSSTIEIYTAQLEAPPASPREQWPEVPPELEAIILRCIALKPSDRFASAAAVGEALAKLRA